MLIDLVLGALVGSFFGVCVSLIPGLGTMQAIWGCFLINPWLPNAMPFAMVSAWIVSAMLSSAKEGVSPELSGNMAAIAAGNIEVLDLDPWCFTQQVFINKLVSLLIALVLGLVFPFVGSSSVLITFLVLGIIYFINRERFSGYEVAFIGYLLGMQFLFWVLNAYGVMHVVYAIGLGIFLIPSCLNAGLREGLEEREVNPGLITQVLGSVFSFLSPGLNQNAWVIGVTRTRTASLEMSMLSADVLVETLGLVLLTQGITNGKSLLAIELQAGLTFWVLPLMVVLAGLCWLMLEWVFDSYRAGIRENWKYTRWFVLLVGTVILLVELKLLILLVVPAGLIVSWLIKRFEIPREIYSLTFVGALL